MTKSFIILLIIVLSSGCTTATRHKWEIPDPSLQYIVLFRGHPEYGDSVVYNSDYCEKIGKACEFFLSHAYAHHVLHHQPLPPTQYPDILEDRADCWAARHAHPDAVIAVVSLMSPGGNPHNIPLTGDLNRRIQNIIRCAEQSGNWVGPDSDR